MINQNERADHQVISHSDAVDFYFTLAQLHVHAKIEALAGDEDKADNLCGEAEAAVYSFAKDAELSGFEWCISVFLEQYPRYSYFIYQGEQAARSAAYINSLRKPGVKGKVTVFCPRGCNQTSVAASSPWDECAACGSIMRPEGEERYYDSLTLAGKVQ